MADATKKRMQRDDRRQQIVASAIDVFGQRGYHAATTSELAKAAGISEALLYQHFDSKKALLLAAIEHLGDWIQDGLQTILAASKDPSLTILQLSDAFRSFIAENPAVTRFTMALSAELDDEDVAGAARKIFERAIGVLTKALSNGQKHGTLRADVPPEALAYVVVSVYQTSSLLERLGLGRRFDGKTIQRLAKPFLQ